MKILIATGIFPPNIGGPATYLPLVAEGLAGRGDDVTVVTMSNGPSGDDAYPFRLARVMRRGGPAARWMAAVRAILKAGRDADVIYAVGLLPHATAANLWLRRPLVARVVSDLAWDRATAYGWTAESLPSFQERRLGLRIEALKAVQRWAIRRAVRVIVPSEWLAGWVRRLNVPAAGIRIVPNGLPPLPAIHPHRAAVATPYLAGMSGRLVPVKRIDMAIRSLRGVPEASLLVIGDGPQKEALQRLTEELALTPRVVFAGAKPRGEMLALLAGCDVFLQCSAHEGFPFSLLEAMGLGMPVIATLVGGVSEIVTDRVNGLLVDGTESSLAAGLRGLLADPDLCRQLGGHAREDVLWRFPLEAMVDATRRVLVEAAAGPAPRSGATWG